MEADSGIRVKNRTNATSWKKKHALPINKHKHDYSVEFIVIVINLAILTGTVTKLQ